MFFSLLSKLYSYETHRFVKKVVNWVYSKWIVSQIPNANKSVSISRDCTIIGKQYISIGMHTNIACHLVLTAWGGYSFANQVFTPEISIGNNVSIGEYVHITAVNRIVIGDGVLTGRRVLITDNSHGDFVKSELEHRPITRPLYSKGEVIIGNNVWIGDKATILPNVHIGEGSIIAANAVVTKDVLEYSVVA